MASERSAEDRVIKKTLQSPTLKSCNFRLSPHISPPLASTKKLSKTEQNKTGLKRLCYSRMGSRLTNKLFSFQLQSCSIIFFFLSKVVPLRSFSLLFHFPLTFLPQGSLQFTRSAVFDSLWPHGLQHARLLCPSLTPGACSNSCPLSL